MYILHERDGGAIEIYVHPNIHQRQQIQLHCAYPVSMQCLISGGMEKNESISPVEQMKKGSAVRLAFV